MDAHGAYKVVIEPLSKENGGGYLAEAPEFPGCMSDGESPQQALENVFDAIDCWLEAAKEMGRPISHHKSRRAA
jgi:antitoxin HicB